MNKRSKGFVVSAVLYPLLVLFLALIMGLLAMTDTRKRILDKMKLEISDSIFDEATCSCDTILNKLNYLIKNGGTGGGGGGSYEQNRLTVKVTGYETESDIPNVGNNEGDIALITTTEVKNYYISPTVPKNPIEGSVWIVMGDVDGYYIQSDYSNIPISYALQYEGEKWTLKKSFVYQNMRWVGLNYISGSDYTWEYDFTGKVQTFKATFTGYYRIELWGAQGGNAVGAGGKGAYTSGKIYLNAGEELYVYVGEQGKNTAGGWNGGGSADNGKNRGGGGSTDVRLLRPAEDTTWKDTSSLKSRIMVAAGGGGGGSSYISGHIGSNSLSESGTHNGSAFYDEHHYFIDTKMIDGEGYKWTSIKGENTGMPDKSGNNDAIGNSGHGHARISLVSLDIKTEDDLKSYVLENNTQMFYAYAGKYQEFFVPKTGKYKVELWGSQGGSNGGTGGLGGYTAGEIYLTKGRMLYVYVGGPGSQSGGWNGGGSSDNSKNRGGGGATDIRTIATTSFTVWNDSTSLKSRIMVAAGGGGAGESASGGAGGGLIGVASSATGGTQIAGGSGTGNSGKFGIGANGYNLASGGGSGWYGGGQATYCYACGSGGGSSYISGHAGCIAVDANGNPKKQTYTTLNDSISYTNEKFTNTKMIDGEGYDWTTARGNNIGQTSKDGKGTVTGNADYGYAQITYIG